jgi:quercetin 2,3-dioxygenase
MKTTGVKTEAGKIVLRPAESRGVTDLGWLHSRHTFSFGDYFDPDQNGFFSLRVLNEDIVEPEGGFGTHPHQDAEIFSYVMEGELQHRDSLGNGSVIKAGNLQYLSAGEGVLHSENNPSETNRLHFLQVWLRPNQMGGAPRYSEVPLGKAAARNALTLVFSGRPREGATQIRQNADIYFGKLDARRNVPLEANPDHGIWLQVLSGDLEVLGETLKAGDGAGLTEQSTLSIRSPSGAEFLAFVMA